MNAAEQQFRDEIIDKIVKLSEPSNEARYRDRLEGKSMEYLTGLLSMLKREAAKPRTDRIMACGAWRTKCQH